MYLLLILLFVVIATVIANKLIDSDSSVKGKLPLLGVIAVALVLFANSFAQISSGSVGVQSIFGSVKQATLTPGLHLVNPLVDVTRFNARTQNYTMSSVHTEGDNAGDDAIRVLTSDELEVVVDLTVLYHVIPQRAPDVYAKIGEDYQDLVVRALSRTVIREDAAEFDAVSLVSAKRGIFQAKITADLQRDFAVRGLSLEKILVRNMQLPGPVKLSIESKVKAQQEAEKMEFVLAKENKEAERKRTEAKGIADYQHIVNAELSDKVLQYESIKAQQAIATSPNAKVIIMNGKTGPQVLVGDK